MIPEDAVYHRLGFFLLFFYFSFRLVLWVPWVLTRGGVTQMVFHAGWKMGSLRGYVG